MLKNTIKVLVMVSMLTGMLAQAQTPPVPSDNRGFAPPPNPFAGQPVGAGGDEMFDEEEEDEEIDDISDEILRQRMEQRLKERASNSTPPSNLSPPSSHTDSVPRGGVDFSAASSALGNTSTHAGANAQIQNGQNSKTCLKLDPYTGYGPDVISNFDFPDADIVEIAKTLGRLTCLNFILDKDVKGRISVVSNAPITVGDAWKAFLTALDVNNYSIIPSGAYMRIARQRDAREKQIKTYSGNFSPDNDLLINRVLPLKYISSEEVARVFRQMMGANTRITAFEQTNTVLITDTGANVKKVVEMIQLLDVEGFDESLEVIRVKNAGAQEIAKLIDQLLPGNTGGGAVPGGVPRFRTGPGGFTPRKTKEGGVISSIISDDRTNSVIVSANVKGLEQVKKLIRKLDSRVSMNEGGSKIHVVYLQFADAEQVAQTLNNLTTGGQAARPTAQVGVASTTSAQLFEGQIRVSPDKPTNSLVITGTPSDFLTVSRVISKLDVPRDQVYVESIIMEIILDRSFELGTSIAAPTSAIGFLPPGSDLGNFLTNPLAVSGLVMGFAAGKGSKDIKVGDQTVTVRSIQGLVKALQKNSNGNVLATPQILTLDNQEAEIEIGDKVPVPSTTQVQGVGQTQSFQREPITLNLKIKPQINKISNFVKLDIAQKLDDISDRVPPGVAQFAFSTSTRSSKTTVVVQDGDTVALGGLVRDKTTETTNKVPLLGDIPILGWLFRSKTTQSTKNNLIAFITPKIIKQYQSVRKILDKKLRERDEFLEKNAGGEDLLEDYKMKLVRELPPVEELKSGARVENSDVEPGTSEEDQHEEEEQEKEKREPSAAAKPEKKLTPEISATKKGKAKKQ